MKEILYLISVVIFIIIITIIKKSQDKMNFTKFFTVMIISFLCYNSFICLILNIFSISITIENLAIINFLISAILASVILKNKEIQKFYINKKDIIAIIVIVIVTLTSAYLNFGIDLNIKYLTTDSAVHFKAAREFYQNDLLLNKTEGTSISKQFMIGAYTNTGILFKVLEPFVGEINLYKVFISFDIFLFLLLGLIMYSAVEKIIKGKKEFFLSIIAIGLFMIGYPLNTLIFGYVYLQLGLTIIGAIIIIYQNYLEEKNNFPYIMLFLFNFGLFFTYCIFVPVIYFSEGLYFLIKEYQEKKKFTFKNIVKIFIILVIPFILGLLYFAIPHISNSNNQTESFFLTIEGYIYRNCWSNFIFVMPLSILSLFKKEKSNLFYKIILTVLIIYMIIFFVVVYKFQLSTYYYYKTNFVLWFVIWYGAIYSINKFKDDEKTKKILMIYCSIYLIFTIIAIKLKYVPITKETFDSDENLTNAFDIYCINRTIISYVEIDYTKEEIKILDYVHRNIDIQKNKVLIIGNPRQEFWFDGIFEYKNRNNLETIIPKEHIENWNDDKNFEYLIIFNRSYYYDNYKEDIIYKDKIFENEAGAIYKQ
ncbi:MAG: hypothetical protein E7310_05960 [Clostridiales bacterium]|nr:hypothetical protein [Clostridiales bacterium]